MHRETTKHEDDFMSTTMEYMSATGMHSDTYATGRLYNKLDAYLISARPESRGVAIYFGSSCQFRTKESYERWLRKRHSIAEFSRLVIRRSKD